MTTYIHKYKCRSCGLHFTVYSWNQERKDPFCPECGENAAFIYWLDETDKEIFQLVPGDAAIVGLT